MRIGVDTRDLKIAMTGARTVLESICEMLPIVGPENEYVFISPDHLIRPGNSALAKIWGHISYYWWKEVQLPSIAKRKGCDILLCTDYVVPLYAHCPTVPVFFGSNFWERPQDYNKIWLFFLNFLGLRAARKSPVVITISHFSRDRIARITGIPKQKIVPVYLAPKKQATAQISDQEINEILGKYGLSPNTPFILHVGVLEKRKNLPRLVRAFAAALPEIGAQYRLVLVGPNGPKQDMDDSANIKKAIEENQVGEQVILTGKVTDHELPAFYGRAALYALPTLYEGFGMPALEAFSHHLPLVASNTTSIPEVVGDAALLIDPENVEEIEQAIIQVLSDEQLRESLITKGDVRASSYSWELTTAKFLGIFRAIVKKEGSWEEVGGTSNHQGVM